jgi:hypothetical protein
VSQIEVRDFLSYRERCEPGHLIATVRARF